MVEILLSGPGKNALGTPVMHKALADLRAARGQSVLLRGEGDALSAGLNLKEIATLDPKALEQYLATFDELLVALLSHDAPLVACVNGHAIAGGSVLMLACDLRVATSKPSALIGLNEVAIGLTFPPRVLKLAKSRLAPSHLARVVLEAGLYSPQEALRLGLVHELADDPIAASRALLEKLDAHPRGAYVETKRELNRAVLELDAHEQETFRERVLPRWTSPEMKDTIARALAKR